MNLPNLITVLFLLVCGTFTYFHPLWRDEAQAFLIGRDSHSIGELLYNTRYEGHPPLWHFLIFLMTRFTQRPEAMQAMHVLMAATSVYLVARFSPFPWPLKCLFPFGYFTLFEYGILARNYQLFLLLALALCALWQHRRFSFVWTGVLLGLLCLTHVLGDILAAGLGAMLLVDALVTREGRQAIRRRPWRLLAGVLIVAASAAAAVHCLIPPPDSGFEVGWDFHWSLSHARDVVGTFAKALVPLSERTEHFWNHIILQDDNERFRWGLTLALAAIVCIAHSWRALLLFLITSLGSLAFFYVKFSGEMRHNGVLFVALITAFWIAWVVRVPTPPSAHRRRRYARAVARFLPRFGLCVLLAVQVYGAGIALYYCWRYPFSPGKTAAAAIRMVLQPGDILVSGNQVLTTSVAAYLPGQVFYFPLGKRWGTFTLWDQTPGGDASNGEAMNFIRRQTHPVIFIRCWDWSILPGATSLGHFDGGIQGDEIYTVYRVEPKLPAAH